MLRNEAELTVGPNLERSPSYWAISIRRLLRKKLGVACLTIILLMYGSGILAPLVTPYGFNDQRKGYCSDVELGRDPHLLLEKFANGPAAVLEAFAEISAEYIFDVTAVLVFALKLDILPTHGWGGLFDTRVILPAVVMGVPGIAIITRLTRASTLEVISQDYIRTARAKGLSEFTVQRRHVLRNAMIPVITMLGFSLAGIAFTSFIVERFFGIPGIGNLFIESIFARDFPIINAVIIIGTTMFVAANLIVDLIYPWLDPRIRLGGSYAA